MDPRAQEHLRVLESLAASGYLDVTGPNATVANPAWFVALEPGEYTPTFARRRLHREILEEWWAETPSPGRTGQAIATAGPSGAGKSSALPEVAESLSSDRFRSIDSDDFKDRLLRRAVADRAINLAVPDDFGVGTRFEGRLWPRELAALVHWEATQLASQALADTVASGDNLIYDGTLSWMPAARTLMHTLDQYRYDVHLVDVETTKDVAAARVQQRWQHPYETLFERYRSGRNIDTELGGRWVPPAVLDRIYADGPDRSVCAQNVDELREEFACIASVNRYWTPNAAAAPFRAESWERGDEGMVHRVHQATLVPAQVPAAVRSVAAAMTGARRATGEAPAEALPDAVDPSRGRDAGLDR
jgi:ribose 1,5-bisphosphokinase PhnN